MRHILVLLLALIVLTFSCKTRHVTEKTHLPAPDQTTEASKTLGKVSHQYRATGCNTVILVENNENTDTLVLIPIDTLSKEFDKDAQLIYFDYRLLKIWNPATCSHGIPATLSNISNK